MFIVWRRGAQTRGVKGAIRDEWVREGGDLWGANEKGALDQPCHCPQWDEMTAARMEGVSTWDPRQPWNHNATEWRWGEIPAFTLAQKVIRLKLQVSKIDFHSLLCLHFFHLNSFENVVHFKDIFPSPSERVCVPSETRARRSIVKQRCWVSHEMVIYRNKPSLVLAKRFWRMSMEAWEHCPYVNLSLGPDSSGYRNWALHEVWASGLLGCTVFSNKTGLQSDQKEKCMTLPLPGTDRCIRCFKKKMQSCDIPLSILHILYSRGEHLKGDGVKLDLGLT